MSTTGVAADNESPQRIPPRPEDLTPARSFIVYSGPDRYPISEDIEAIGIKDMAALLAGAP